MGKQVILKGNTLHVRTSEDYDSASKVICLKQGKKAKVFYAYTPFINDLESITGATICGYRIEQLVTFAEILRDRRVEDIDLKDFDGAYIAGYQRAQDDIKKDIEKSIQRMFDDINGKVDDKKGEEA